ncbi:MAG: hypothetical protein IJ523_10880 [Succinivibrionaceae bacterium]|nr:hypothetical protein [Succinivibrionaceae bacterium]
MNIVDIMIELRNTRKSELLEHIDPDNLTVIVTEILSWLRLERKREIWLEQGRPTALKSLALNMNYPWCADLVKILQNDNVFAEVFQVDGKHLSFKDSVTDDYRHEARLLAYEKYDPKMITG